MKEHIVQINVVTHGEYCASAEIENPCPFVTVIYENDDAKLPNMVVCTLFKAGLEHVPDDLAYTVVPIRCEKCINYFDKQQPSEHFLKEH